MSADGKIVFRKQIPGLYWGDSERHCFRILREDMEVRRARNAWLLDVRERTTTAGVRHALGQPILASDHFDSMRDARMVAAKFAQIVGNTPWFNVRYVMREAADQFYREEVERARAEYDRHRAEFG